jgi:methyl-accepting chemotaxis protein
MTRLRENADNLMKVVDNVNERITNLAASTEEIAASATMVGQVASELHDKFDKIRAL